MLILGSSTIGFAQDHARDSNTEVVSRKVSVTKRYGNVIVSQETWVEAPATGVPRRDSALRTEKVMPREEPILRRFDAAGTEPIAIKSKDGTPVRMEIPINFRSSQSTTSQRLEVGEQTVRPTDNVFTNQSAPGLANTPARPQATSNREQKIVPEPPKPMLDIERLPFATKSADSPNFVNSPYPPNRKLDVAGLSSGSLAKDPTTGKIFRVP